MRLYRRRRQQGVQHIRIPLHATDIDGLIRAQYLAKEERQDHDAIRRAIFFALHDTCYFGWENDLGEIKSPSGCP